MNLQKSQKLKKKVNLKRTQSQYTDLTINASIQTRPIRNSSLNQSNVEVKGKSVDAIYGSERVNQVVMDGQYKGEDNPTNMCKLSLSDDVDQLTNQNQQRNFKHSSNEPVVPAVPNLENSYKSQFFPSIQSQTQVIQTKENIFNGRSNRSQSQNFNGSAPLPNADIDFSKPSADVAPYLLMIKTVQEVKQSKQPMQEGQLKQLVGKLVQRSNINITLPFFQNSKTSTKSFGSVRSFAANTNVGTVRKSNEDRIAIILNVVQPLQRQTKAKSWPQLHVFCVLDGHGGYICAEFLKDNFINNVVVQSEFPDNIEVALRKGAQKTENDFFLQKALNQNGQIVNKSGSCALMLFIVNDDVYVINVGDSRALTSISQMDGQSYVSQVKQMTKDHKPSDPQEFQRITQAGGYVYQTRTAIQNGVAQNQVIQVKIDQPPEIDSDEDNPLVGPYRVFPGRLSVCRTFGDIEAKVANYGGIPGCVTCEPEIIFEPNGTQILDYVLIGSDGIFDKMKNDYINQIIWDIATKERIKHLNSPGVTPTTLNAICGLIVDQVVQSAARHHSLDNLSVVFVAFKRFQDYVEQGLRLINKGSNKKAYSSFEETKQTYSSDNQTPLVKQDKLEQNSIYSNKKHTGQRRKSESRTELNESLLAQSKLQSQTQSLLQLNIEQFERPQTRFTNQRSQIQFTETGKKILPPMLKSISGNIQQRTDQTLSQSPSNVYRDNRNIQVKVIKAQKAVKQQDRGNN